MKRTAIFQRKRPGAPAWFNKWIQSPAWFYSFCAAVGLSGILYGIAVSTRGIQPGSGIGLWYGIGAVVALVAVLLITVRRRTMKLRPPGTAWVYLQVHVYGGGLFLLLMLMHTGFRIPYGIHTWWLWILSLWVVLSGFMGVVIQKWIPTILTAGLSTEVHFDRIEELVDNLRTRSEKLVAGSSYRLQDFYRENLAAAFTGATRRLIYFVDITGGIRQRTKRFDSLEKVLDENDAHTLRELRTLYTSKLELDAHYTLQRALRAWLIVHVPVSIVLVALLLVHIFTVVYY